MICHFALICINGGVFQNISQDTFVKVIEILALVMVYRLRKQEHNFYNPSIVKILRKNK